MTYQQMIASLAESSGLSKQQVDALLYHFARLVPDACVRGDRLLLPGLGVFRVKTRKGRRLMNPATRELMELEATQTLTFRAAKRAKAAVSR